MVSFLCATTGFSSGQPWEGIWFAISCLIACIVCIGSLFLNIVFTDLILDYTNILFVIWVLLFMMLLLYLFLPNFICLQNSFQLSLLFKRCSLVLLSFFAGFVIIISCCFIIYDSSCMPLMSHSYYHLLFFAFV